MHLCYLVSAICITAIQSVNRKFQGGFCIVTRSGSITTTASSAVQAYYVYILTLNKCYKGQFNVLKAKLVLILLEFEFKSIRS